ncbi:MAG: hypothetical protein ACYCS9_05205 [Candidatus Dormibacteria bacterium]
MTTDTTATVRRSVVVDAPIERAFTFFTNDIGRMVGSRQAPIGGALELT